MKFLVIGSNIVYDSLPNIFFDKSTSDELEWLTMSEHEGKPAINEVPTHPCYGCLNTLSTESKEIINDSTVCLEGKTPKPNCPFKVTSETPVAY